MIHPMKRRLLLLLLIACLALSTLADARPAAAQAGEMLGLINQLRASMGLPPFTPDPALMAAAQAHAEWMAANLSYTHTGAGGSSPQQRATAAGYQGYVAENIVGGTNLSPQQGLVWWENSAIHYATLTSPRYIHAGVGFASNSGQNLYALVVGAPSDYAPASGAPGASAPAAEQAPPPIVIPVVTAQPREDGAIIHEVQMGQTAWDIAIVYGVDLEELLAINHLPDNPILFPGDNVIVRPGSYTPEPEGPLTHTVREGQSLWAIAARYGISLDDLRWLNSLPPDAVIKPGDVLTIRLAEGQSPPPTPTPVTTHIVRAGETLWTIAARYGLTLEELLALNGLEPGAVLLAGVELVIHRPDPTMTPTELPTPTPAGSLPPPTATTGPMPTTIGVTQLPPASPSPPAVALQPSPPPGTATASPTPIPAPPPSRGATLRGMLGGIVIGLGLLVLLVMGIIEGRERLSRRRDRE